MTSKKIILIVYGVLLTRLVKIRTLNFCVSQIHISRDFFRERCLNLKKFWLSPEMSEFVSLKFINFA